MKPIDGRTRAWVSLDGATRFALEEGESITIKASPYPMAFVTDPYENVTEIWANKLRKLLNWNKRPNMKVLKKKEIQHMPYENSIS